jgi:hypothetical protein
VKHYLGLCLVLATIAAIVLLGLHECAAESRATVASVRDAFVSVFHVQPEIRVHEETIMTQTAPIAELAVAQRDEKVSRGVDEHVAVGAFTVPLTHKEIEASAVFRVKAGFDLREPFRVTFDPATGNVEATLPHARILSVEQVGDLSEQAQDSVLNRLSDEDRANLVNDLNHTARAAAESSGLIQDAEEQATTRLRQILEHNGQKAVLRFSDAPTPPPAVQP